MKSKIDNQKTPGTKYNVRYIQSFPINLPATQIDLYKWITEMTEQDYTSYSPAHLAMNSYVKDAVLFMTNVENVSTDTVVQHYEMKYHSQSHVQFYSAKSEAFVMRWFRVLVGVPWEMQIRELPGNTCELVCLVGADYPNLFLKAASWFAGLGGLFLKRHLVKEGREFARHIQEKFSLNKQVNFKFHTAE
ncbi:MAG: hypothetical protein QM791_18405 [Ferruginibacter sp.]